MTPSNPAVHGRRRPLLLVLGILVLLLGSLLASSHLFLREDDNLHILCSFLPVYVFTLNVVGDTPGVEVDLLLSPDLGCPHDYALRPGDLVRVNRADLIVAHGLDAEPFLDTILSNKGDGRVLTISDDVDALEASHECDEEPRDAAGPHTESSADGEHDDHDHAGHHHHHHGHYNPHVWASPAQAAREVRTLGRKLAAADKERASHYLANAERYASRLESLAERMRAASRNFKNRNIVTFHDAFAYLARDLDLNVVTTLTVEPDAGVSAFQMRELADTIRRQRVAAIFHEPAYSERLARSLADQTGVPSYSLNPFNFAAGRPDADAYEQVMEENLRTLQKALGEQP